MSSVVGPLGAGRDGELEVNGVEQGGIDLTLK